MKQKYLLQEKAAPSRLQRELSAGILDLIRTEKLAPGTRLAEVALAVRLQVSRTPVRAALKLLASRRLVRQGARRGYFVAAVPAAPKTPGKPAPADADRLFLAIARDRRGGRLPVDVSERDLMQRYGATRPVVQRVLTKLAEVAAVQRKPGHGWRFQPIIADAAARHESYRYRILIEPAQEMLHERRFAHARRARDQDQVCGAASTRRERLVQLLELGFAAVLPDSLNDDVVERIVEGGTLSVNDSCEITWKSSHGRFTQHCG